MGRRCNSGRAWCTFLAHQHRAFQRAMVLVPPGKRRRRKREGPVVPMKALGTRGKVIGPAIRGAHVPLTARQRLAIRRATMASARARMGRKIIGRVKGYGGR